MVDSWDRPFWKEPRTRVQGVRVNSFKHLLPQYLNGHSECRKQLGFSFVGVKELGYIYSKGYPHCSAASSPPLALTEQSP